MNQTIYSDRREFEAMVSSLLATESPGSFGKLHVVTISHGDDEAAWTRLLPKAASIAESILHARLGNGDSCLKMADGQYLLLFPHLSEREGIVRAAAIAQEIKQRLFGQTKSTLEVSVQVLPLTRLKPRAAANAVDDMDNVLKRHAKQSGIDIDVVFQPVWNQPQQAVIGNRARIRRHFNNYELFEAAVLFGGEQDPLAVDANAILCRAAHHAAKVPGVLFLPQAINDYAMIDDAETAVIVRDLVRGRAGPLVIELAGAVASVAHSRLRETIQTIHTAGAKVAVRTIPEVETSKFLRECGVEYLCLNEAQVKMAGLTPSAIFALFTIIAHEVRGLGFQLCLWNAGLSQDVKRAIPLGYSLFSGPVIGAHATKPAAAHPLADFKVFA